MLELFIKKLKKKHGLFRRQYLTPAELETLEAREVQKHSDLSTLENAQKLIVFLVPSETKINGGVMSIYSLCSTSRKFNSDSVCVISTYPGSKYTYAYNDMFINDEKIYRFSQIVNSCKNLEKLILHVPEYYVKDIARDFKKEDIVFLKSIKSLHINIVNQNIEYMPTVLQMNDLYKITENITQTIAHDRYATQEICNQFNIPTHLFSTNIDITKYKYRTFKEKDNIIVLSPDCNRCKDAIVKKIREEMLDFEIVSVENMSFSQYMDLISRAYFTVTFGEGMDGYFIQPYYVGSIGFAAYNEAFFPNDDWKKMRTIYGNYEYMLQNIVQDMNMLLNDNLLYEKIVSDTVEKLSQIYSTIKFENNIRRFYMKDYDFVPQIQERL